MIYERTYRQLQGSGAVEDQKTFWRLCALSNHLRESDIKVLPFKTSLTAVSRSTVSLGLCDVAQEASSQRRYRL
jgi:hypothetical protein